MKVMVLGQQKDWVNALRQICQEKQIEITEEVLPEEQVDLLVSDFPLETGKGIPKRIPFLVISRKKEEHMILKAFAQGAEGYLVMPVSPRIAAVRIESILRRYGYKSSDISFTPNEYRIVSFMMRHPQHVLSREQLLEGAFFHDYEGIDRNVDNYIKDIRKKMRAAGEADQIQTVYGAGYRYVPGK